jgi:DNA-binding YbaB/EbfC family protein
MLSQAKKMQEKMSEVQENLKNIEVEGVSGGSLVKVTLKGDYEMKSIFVDKDAKKEKDEIINDLIIAAYNDAKNKLKKKTSEEIAKATGMPNLPFDIKLPF